MRNKSAQKSVSIPVSTMLGTVAAWTLAYSGDMLTYTCDATDETAGVVVPLHMPKIVDGGNDGVSEISYVELSYTVGTAALDAAPAAEIQSVAKAVDGAAPVVTTKACTVAGVTVTDTKTVDDHLITITPDAALRLNDAGELILEVLFNKAATSTVAITGCKVVYHELMADAE